MAIVASEKGGLIPCVGGPYTLPDGREAVKALAWEDVRQIVKRFDRLNPYDRTVVRASLLKIEDVNFDNGIQRELWGYAIAAKRYVLFTRPSVSRIEIKKASAHGLGFLYAPTPEFNADVDAPRWVLEAWDWIMRSVLDLPRVEPWWFQLPAMMRIKITTPEVLKALQTRQARLPYRDRVKPFNFALSPIIDHLGGYPVGADPYRFLLLTAFSSDPASWYGRSYVNVYDGKIYRLAPISKRKSHEVGAKTIGDFIRQYRLHPEAKSLAPDGKPCSPRTQGLLRRSPVTAAGFRYIGKETDRRWEQGEDISLLESEVLEYRPNETERLVADPDLQRDAKHVSIRTLARKAGVTENTVKAARRGDRLRKSKVAQLKRALRELDIL